MKFTLGFLSALALIAVVALAVILTGGYNVAATAGHGSVGRWVFETTMEHSVEARADDAAPGREAFANADLRAGFGEFQEYCVHCHGAPGVEPHEWASGMVPDPPELSRAAGEWTSAQIFWIVKHGIKMSGMPAFGDSESDATIVNIAAFVDRMEGMTPARYAELRARWGSAEASEDGHGH